MLLDEPVVVRGVSLALSGAGAPRNADTERSTRLRLALATRAASGGRRIVDVEDEEGDDGTGLVLTQSVGASVGDSSGLGVRSAASKASWVQWLQLGLEQLWL